MSPSTIATAERVYRDDTLDAYQRGVERAIDVMRDQLAEPLTVDDLADAAFMSRYHFTRVFAKITGASPARFLAAVRMQEAKRRLLKTDRSVTDISLDVGYNSLGTFTRIFADFVGFPPVRFRQLSQALLALTFEDVARFLPPRDSCMRPPSLTGEIVCSRELALVTVAMFPTAIPRSRPIECACRSGIGSFSFHRAPSSCYHILAAGMTPTATMEDALLNSPEDVFVGMSRCSPFSRSEPQITLHTHKLAEPPVVVAFPLLIVESIASTQASIFGEAGQVTA